MAESVLMDAFVTGLEPTLQVEVVNRYPQTLEACMREAQLVNDRNLALQFTWVELGIPELGGVEPHSVAYDQIILLHFEQNYSN